MVLSRSGPGANLRTSRRTRYVVVSEIWFFINRAALGVRSSLDCEQDVTETHDEFGTSVHTRGLLPGAYPHPHTVYQDR